MSACEECWKRANEDVMLLGGSVVERYQRRIREHQESIDRAHAQLEGEQR